MKKSLAPLLIVLTLSLQIGLGAEPAWSSGGGAGGLNEFFVEALYAGYKIITAVAVLILLIRLEKRRREHSKPTPVTICILAIAIVLCAAPYVYECLDEQLMLTHRKFSELRDRFYTVYHKGDYVQALNLIDKLINCAVKDPKDTGVSMQSLYRQRASCLLNLGRTDAAMTDAKIALENSQKTHANETEYQSQGDLVSSYLMRAACLMKLGRNEDALTDATDALQYAPGVDQKARIYWSLADIHMNMGKTELAQSEYMKADKLAPWITKMIRDHSLDY